MKRKFEILIVLLVILIVCGALIFAYKKGELQKGNNFLSADWGKEKITTKEFEANEKIIYFDIDAPNSRLEVIKNNDNKIKIEVIDSEKIYYDINQNDKKIEIEKHKNSKENVFGWGESTGIVKIYIPEDIISDYEVDISNGSINISDITVQDMKVETSNAEIILNDLITEGKIEIKSSNGNINVENVSCKNINLTSSNGQANIRKIKANKKIEIQTSNGSIYAEECYSEKVKLNTSNGSVTIENIDDKNFVIDEIEINTSNGSENINANYRHKI